MGSASWNPVLEVNPDGSISVNSDIDISWPAGIILQPDVCHFSLCEPGEYIKVERWQIRHIKMGPIYQDFIFQPMQSSLKAVFKHLCQLLWHVLIKLPDGTLYHINSILVCPIQRCLDMCMLSYIF